MRSASPPKYSFEVIDEGPIDGRDHAELYLQLRAAHKDVTSFVVEFIEDTYVVKKGTYEAGYRYLFGRNTEIIPPSNKAFPKKYADIIDEWEPSNDT